MVLRRVCNLRSPSEKFASFRCGVYVFQLFRHADFIFLSRGSGSPELWGPLVTGRVFLVSGYCFRSRVYFFFCWSSIWTHMVLKPRFCLTHLQLSQIRPERYKETISYGRGQVCLSLRECLKRWVYHKPFLCSHRDKQTATQMSALCRESQLVDYAAFVMFYGLNHRKAYAVSTDVLHQEGKERKKEKSLRLKPNICLGFRGTWQDNEKHDKVGQLKNNKRTFLFCRMYRSCHGSEDMSENNKRATQRSLSQGTGEGKMEKHDPQDEWKAWHV